MLAATGWGLRYLWGDDAPEGLLSGKTNIVVLGTDTRKGDTGRSDTLFVVMMDPDNTDPRMDPAKNPVPFDGKRMIFGGFVPVVDFK